MSDALHLRDLVTALVMSKRLGLRRTQRVHQLTARLTDPMPAHVWAQPRVHLWFWPDVREWASRQDGLEILEPGVPATAAQVAERLGLTADALPAAGTDGAWDWGVAEQVWIDSLMNVHRN